MSFLYLNAEQKQHINLSPYALSIMENDMFSFQIHNKSTFINKIIDNYKYEANASISLSSQRYRVQLETTLSVVQSCSAIEVIEILVAEYISSVKRNVNSYCKGQGFKIRLNKENVDYLTYECKEEIHYANIGSYLKAIIEEYCTKSFLERERIFYKDFFSTISLAIKDKKILSIQFPSGRYLHIKPYSLTTDPLSMYHYLVGYEIIKDDYKSTQSSFSCRVSNLKNIKLLQEHSFISMENQKNLASDILEKGAQFMCEETSETIIYLTDSGIKKYNRLLHLRPQFTAISKDRHTYTFNCTLLQIEYYFFKFGTDAIIISPYEIKTRFQSMYSLAAEKYLSI